MYVNTAADTFADGRGIRSSSERNSPVKVSFVGAQAVSAGQDGSCRDHRRVCKFPEWPTRS